MQIALPTTAKRDHHPRPPASPPPPRRAGTQEGGGTKTVVADSSFGRVTKMTAAQVGRQAGRQAPTPDKYRYSKREEKVATATDFRVHGVRHFDACAGRSLLGWLAGWLVGRLQLARFYPRYLLKELRLEFCSGTTKLWSGAAPPPTKAWGARATINLVKEFSRTIF